MKVQVGCNDDEGNKMNIGTQISVIGIWEKRSQKIRETHWVCDHKHKDKVDPYAR